MIQLLLNGADPILKKLVGNKREREFVLIQLFSNSISLSRLQRCYANMQDGNGKTPLSRAAEKKSY